MKKIIIFAVAGVVLIGAGVGGALFFLKSPENTDEEQLTEAETPEKETKEAKEAIYENMHPAFTINFKEGSKKKFMQVYMVAMFYDMDSRDSFKMHMPVVRNKILMTLTGKDSDELSTQEAREQLRIDSLQAAQSVMQDRYGENMIEDIFFTKLVMQ